MDCSKGRLRATIFESDETEHLILLCYFGKAVRCAVSAENKMVARKRQPVKRCEYQTLVLNDRPFGNELAVSFFRRCARLHLCAYDFHCSIQKRRGKLGHNVSFNESYVLYYEFLLYLKPMNFRFCGQVLSLLSVLFLKEVVKGSKTLYV